MNDQIDFKMQVALLEVDYPAVYIAYLQSYGIGMQETLEAYIKKCLCLEDAGPGTYEQYIHGGVLPTLQRFRDAKLLKKGNSP